MSVRNLDKLFKPRSVALIGATDRAGSVGAVLLRNLRRAGFAGRVAAGQSAPSDPRRHAGVPATSQACRRRPISRSSSRRRIPCPALVAALGARGTKAAVVITAGFGELGEAGRRLQQAMLDAARPHLLRIIGPNCVGIIVPRLGLDASFSHLAPPPGDIALVSQSGAMVTAMLDWAAPRGIGFSHVVSLGDMADVDFGDMLDYLARRPGHPRDPALCRRHHPRAQVHVGGARRRARPSRCWC